jgi:hypothetical protein
MYHKSEYFNNMIHLKCNQKEEWYTQYDYKVVERVVQNVRGAD